MFQLLPALILLLLQSQSHGNGAFFNGRAATLAQVRYGSSSEAFLGEADRSLQRAFLAHLIVSNAGGQNFPIGPASGSKPRTFRSEEDANEASRAVGSPIWSDRSVVLTSVRLRDGPR